MTDIRVHHAALLPGPKGEGLWNLAVEVTRDGETRHVLHVIPADAIEWRIAQFNVDAEIAARMLVVEAYGVYDNGLFTAPTRSQARNRKLQILDETLDGGTLTWVDGSPLFRAVGENGPELLADSGDGNPLQTIIEASPVDDEHIAVKREWMDSHREVSRRRREQQAETEQSDKERGKRPQLRRPSPEQLRERLNPRQRTQAEPSGPADTRGRER